jgi:hypothetical protein
MPATAARTGLRRVPWWVWTLLAIAVAVAVTAALGGFATAPISKVPTIGLGSTFHGQEIDARVLGARLTGTSPTGEKAPAGHRWLELDLRSENTGDAPVPADAITLRTIVGSLDGTTRADRTLTSRDRGGIAELQPGIPTDLALLWKVPTGSVHDGDPIVVGVFESVPATGGAVYRDAYTAPDVKARVAFAVGDAA